ncbi:MAG: GGDEF domain-containing protein [Thermoguttaceae bacterium]|jgi:diguanylate cyclase (GGDEF)-like protein
MGDSSATTVLILAEPADLARQWAEILRGADFSVYGDWAASPQRPPPEVVVTNLAEPDPRACQDAAVIAIGCEAPAALTLPRDFLARELQTACRLLGEIARLRRRERLAAATQQELLSAALSDPLTGLPNRRAWDAALAGRLAKLAAAGQRLCLALVDLDRLKQINDTHGHAVGDEVLRATARGLAGALRHDDFVARLGGDEFGLLLWLPREAAAAQVVERVRLAAVARLAETAAPEATLSAGYGLAEPGAPLPCPEPLLSAADAALRSAKQQGRNRSSGPTISPANGY